MANISIVHLMNTPLENNMKNTLYFNSVQNQQNYMQRQIIKTYPNLSYQRDTSVFRCPSHIDSIRNCNYLMFQNPNYSNKWFYCFITKMTYIDDGRTDIEFEVDPLQTFMFDIQIKPSFVEREHTNNDTIGFNTVPENIEHGEYVTNGIDSDNNLESIAYIVQTTQHYNYNADSTTQTGQSATNFGGIYNAGTVFYIEDILSLSWLCQEYDRRGKGSAITNVYVVPRAIVTNKPTEPITSKGTNWWRGMSLPASYEKSISKNYSLDGYNPRNKKLLTFPYNLLILNNNAGSSNILKYEDFSTNDCSFKITGIPTCGGSIKCIPVNYKNTPEYEQEGIIAGKFPTCSWTNDHYTNWLTQNSLNLNLGAISKASSSVLGIIGSAVTGNAVGSIGSAIGGISAIGSQIAEQKQHEIIPATSAGNVNGGDITNTNRKNKFYFIKLSIKSEYAKIIDDFFDMFGYAVHRVKIPNTNHRANYWYIKTIDVNITGNVPHDYLNKIKNAYNNGITFWRNSINYLNYGINNQIN